MEETLNPVSIILVSNGTRGDKLLFMYPCDRPEQTPFKRPPEAEYGSHSQFAVSSVEYDSIPDPKSMFEDGYLSSSIISDDMIAHLFTVKPQLCNEPFELKINDARFVGYPVRVEREMLGEDERGKGGGGGGGGEEEKTEDTPTILLFNVIFVLQASASKTTVASYQELSKRIALAILHEEHRCQYLSQEAKTMNECHEEVLSMPESQCQYVSPYRLMLDTSELSQHLQNIFTDIVETGSCSLHINGWIEISFCIPQKVYSKLGIPPITFENLERNLNKLRSFHSILLLEDAEDIIASLPVDSSPPLCRLLRNQSSVANLQTIAADTDLPLSQVCMLVRHLVCWGKAIVIFPICEANVYMVFPNASLSNHILQETFMETFSGRNLMSVLAEFSPPISLGEFLSPLFQDAGNEAEKIDIILWLLQRRLIMQLHTFAFLSIPSDLDKMDISFKEDTQLLPEEKILEISQSYPDEDVFNAALKCVYNSSFKLSSDRIEEDLKLFASLLPYFNGQYHVEDMMYRLNCKRGDIFRILDKFKPIVITYLKPDTLAAGLE